MDSFDDIWNAVLDYFKARISSTAYDLWIKTIKFEGFENSTVTLRLPKQMHMSIVPSQYGELFYEAFDNILGFKVVITYVTDDIFESKKDNKISYQDRNLEDYRNEQFTFENFIVGPSNRFAYAAAKAVASDPGSKLSNGAGFSNYNPLFIYGNSGLGKTHLLNAICHEIERNFPEMTIMYVRAEQFANEFYQALQNKTIDDFHSKYRDNIDVLLIDDIQFISGKTSTEEEFFHTFDTLVYAGKQVVLTSDRPPREIPSITERVKSRFEEGLLADVQPPEFETRCEIIKRKAALLDFNIDDSVVSYIAEKIKSNIRQLEGVTKKLYALCNINEHAPTIALAQNVIKVVMEDTQPLPVTIQRIIDEVSRTTGVSIEDIYSDTRKANVAKARRIAIYVIIKVTNMSLEEIGAEFKKDHTTIMYNRDKLEEEIKTDSKLARQVNDIISNIRSNQ